MKKISKYIYHKLHIHNILYFVQIFRTDFVSGYTHVINNSGGVCGLLAAISSMSPVPGASVGQITGKYHLIKYLLTFRTC